MRIAIIDPVPGKTTPGHEKSASLLTESLAERGIEVTLFTTEDAVGDPDMIETMHIAEVFQQADNFDLIHNFAGWRALPFTSMVKTPVVSTIHDLSEKHLPVYKKFNPHVSYVSISDADRSDDLDYDATLYHSVDMEKDTVEHMTEAYLRLYTRIIESRSREDHRPWGNYYVIADEPDHKVKRIVVYPGKRLSLQRHQHRDEHWFMIRGEGIITCGEEDIRAPKGHAVDIPRGAVHRIANKTDQDIAFIEVQTGDYFGEDDIERLEDDFGRA